MSRRICEGVYLVGGGGLSAPADCLVYLIDAGERILVDSGVGAGWPVIRDNIAALGFDPSDLQALLLTHCHVDHIGAASAAKELSGCRLVAHEADAEAIESGDPGRTAADWYGITLPELRLDELLTGDGGALDLGGGRVSWIHIPGHTPGSIAILFDSVDGHRVLFGQDIHGPFDPAFESDISQWRASMERLIALGADILCEGHYGVFEGAEAVREFIAGQLAEHR